MQLLSAFKYPWNIKSQKFFLNYIFKGNKIDLKAQRKISFEEANKFAKENFLLASMEISAKDNLRIEDSFLTLTRVSFLV